MWNKETNTKCEQALSTALNFSSTLHNCLYVSWVGVGETSFWNVPPMIIQYYWNFTHVEIMLWQHKYLVAASKRQRHLVFDFSDIRIEFWIYVSSENWYCKFFITCLLYCRLLYYRQICLVHLQARSQSSEKRLLTSSGMSVRHSVRVEQLGTNWTDFHEIWYLRTFWKPVEKIQVSLKSDKNNGYFTWRRMEIFDRISLSSSENDKCFRHAC
jgi:hypothetical protein